MTIYVCDYVVGVKCSSRQCTTDDKMKMGTPMGMNPGFEPCPKHSKRSPNPRPMMVIYKSTTPHSVDGRCLLLGKSMNPRPVRQCRKKTKPKVEERVKEKKGLA
jgi:hypothetical protein